MNLEDVWNSIEQI